MAAVIRVKRRVDEEPLNAFVLNCKKRKVHDGTAEAQQSSSLLENKDETTTILKFAGTVENQENIGSHLSKLSKLEAIEAAAKIRKPNNVTSRNRDQHKQDAHEDRFRIVNCYRTDEQTNSEGDQPTNITVVDIEKQQASETATVQTAQVASTSAAVEHFVYDLYLPEANQTTELDENLVDTLLSIRPFDDLTYGSRKDNGLGDSSDNESEDSNDENNWRNEYPDTEDENDDSTNEKDMRRAIGGMGLDSDNELSSDEDAYVAQQGFVHSIDTSGMEDDIDLVDENRYGVAYAKYKARIRRNMDNSDNSDKDDDDYNSEDYFHVPTDSDATDNSDVESD